ncbi:MAG: hypothetical protein PW786_00895 [Arachidicoccus sp.]|nr:hypothetical protein [Arachidicoccus sp.]
MEKCFDALEIIVFTGKYFSGSSKEFPASPLRAFKVVSVASRLILFTFSI